MSKFLEIPSAATSRNSFRTAVLYYIVEDFRPDLYHIIPHPQDPLEGKEKELIQLLIDNSNNKLRMYDPPRSFSKMSIFIKTFLEIINYSAAPPAEYQQHIAEFSRLSKDEIFEKFKALVPHIRCGQFLYNLIDFSQSDIPSTEQIVRYYMACNDPIKALGTIIDDNPDMFLQFPEDSDEPLTLRVFEDGDQKFLMDCEIFETDFDQNSFSLSTIKMEEVLEDSDLEDVEFIRYPITRSKHRATPIQGPSGNFYILAIDYFFEFLRDLIHGKQIFQKIKPTDLLEFLENLNGLCEVLYEEEDIHFIRTDAILSLKDIDDFLYIPAKDVRNVEKDGFTVQNLKNELAYLGLTTTFPEIQDYAEAVYSEVEKRKKESVLRTCDMFDAIEHCQLNCILDRLPELKKFVHNQKGCHRVYGFKCEDCNSENPETQENQKLSILEKELADLKIAYQKVLEENRQKLLENEELQQKNLRLSVKNESNEVKIKQLTEKLSQSKLSIDDGNYSNICTSQQKIQCLICEKSIESGQDQIIRCPLCKRRFHAKCAINWLQEHQQCPACNGDLSKF